VVFFDHLKDVYLGEPHRDVPDHQRRQKLLAIEHGEEVNQVVSRVCRWLHGRYSLEHLLTLVVALQS
jgi:hypothetical protein